jgi:hypothetical protein
MSEATVLESRVNKLEQDNRRLKLTVGALLLVMAGAACAGAMMPEQISQVIEAREFRMIDANGTVLIAINDEGFSYFDEIGRVSTGFSHGEILASMSTEPSDVIDARMFRVIDENGVVRAGITAELGFDVRDEDGTIRAMMTVHGFTYADENGDVVWRAPER